VGVYATSEVAERVLFSLFDLMSEQAFREAGLLIGGLAMWVALILGNALACFLVAYSLWKRSEWGRQLVFIYDGFIFLMSLAMVTLPLYAPTTSNTSFQFLLECAFVVLISGSTILVCIRSFKTPV